eukprot:jgi/Mesen1/4507/ME000023S03882
MVRAAGSSDQQLNQSRDCMGKSSACNQGRGDSPISPTDTNSCDSRFPLQSESTPAVRLASSKEVIGIVADKDKSSVIEAMVEGEIQADALDALERIMSAAMKGFIIGTGLKGGLALFGILGHLVRPGKKRPGVGSRSIREAASLGLKETLRYGFFLGAFAGGYCTVDESILAVGGHSRTAKWRAIVAGAAAGPALLLTGRKEQHTSLALYILVRAAVLAARCGIKSPRWGWLFRPLTWQYGDVLLMCMSSAQILYAWIKEPHSLPSSYIAFLNKHGGKDPRITSFVRQVASPQRPLELASVEAAYRDAGREVCLDPHMVLPCGMLHPGQACLPHFLSFLGGAYLRALPVYLPVYVIPALLVHRRALLSSPLPILSKTAKGAARSSLFLASYCASAWLWTCCVHQLTGACSGATLACGTFPAGAAVLLEKKSRRMELALYCASRAIESFALCARAWGWRLPAPLALRGARAPRADVLAFGAATAVIMHCYANERDVFRSKYLNVLDWVFGCPPLRALQQAQGGLGGYPYYTDSHLSAFTPVLAPAPAPSAPAPPSHVGGTRLTDSPVQGLVHAHPRPFEPGAPSNSSSLLLTTDSALAYGRGLAREPRRSSLDGGRPSFAAMAEAVAALTPLWPSSEGLSD